MKAPLRVLLFFLLSTVGAYSQVVLFNNMLTPSDTTHGGPYVRGSGSVSGRQDAAEQFQSTLAGAAFLTSVVVPFHAFAAPGPMSGTAILFADSANNPGSILETASFSATLSNSTTTLITVNFSGASLIAPATNYWIGFSLPPGSSFWELWDSAQPTASNRLVTSSNGTAWTALPGSPAPGLTVNGRVVTPVPEPASYGLGAAGLLAGLVAWRKRRFALAR